MSILTTLLLRPLTEADATPEYAAWFADLETRRWIASPTPTVEACRAYIRRYEGQEDARLWAICVDGRHVGNLKVERHGDEAELGLLIAPAERGQGYAQLAIGEAVAWCAAVWSVKGIRAGVHPFNTRSMRLFERCGFAPQDARVWVHLKTP